jgi:hypothetical protein
VVQGVSGRVPDGHNVVQMRRTMVQSHSVKGRSLEGNGMKLGLLLRKRYLGGSGWWSWAGSRAL